MVLSVLCGKNSKNNGGENEEEKFFVEELSNMQLTEAILMHLDKQLTKVVALLLNDAPNQQQNPMLSAEASTLTDLVGPYFQVLARLCTDSKYVRRYCRIRVIPPLVSEEVQKRPEENNTLRGRIARIMMLPSSTKDVAAEFLFIICKRSVNRMIKYLGFGHSAGHLANLGLLGQINQPKHASDSEDSETEDYNQIKDSVNPVTGAIYPSDHGSALAGMSEEQKEYEAMKLVDAMNQMMETGIVKPGTIGDDGKIREVSHVLELLKNAPEPAPAENSDSDEE
ncbi:Synembryn-A [Caenorhabditis elegans]|nr:Synembryn-A [Caenorhabditis elegans]CDH93411.1 Synembryn-A [Caenorhabditis elegans]|eukprot:NP_001294607.1 Synembryn [Caenorhabditis elegans]